MRMQRTARSQWLAIWAQARRRKRAAVNATPNASDVLVITKAGLKFNWLNELKRWLVNPLLRESVGIADGKAFPSTRVVIMNFDIAHVWPKSLARMWDVVIVDECFPAGTQVKTPGGMRRIENIKAGDAVCNAVGVGTVMAVSERSTEEKLWRIETQAGAVECTAGHPFLTDDGWVKAYNLREGQLLKTHEETMRVVREGFRGVPSEAFLRNLLFGEMEDDTTTRTGCVVQRSCEEEAIATTQGVAQSESAIRNGSIAAHEDEQPDALGNGEGESFANAENDASRSKGSRRERNRANQGRVDSSGTDAGRAMELRSGAWAKDGRTSNLLQIRPCVAGSESWLGGGRILSRSNGKEGKGQEERGEIAGIRVVRVKVLKRGSNNADGTGLRSSKVYNLQVSGHPSYVVTDAELVVHNCHLLKNPATRRAKAIIGYKPKRSEDPALARSGIGAKRKLALTGTPIENRLEELWTVLWWLDPAKFPSKWKLLKLAGITYAGSGATAPTEIGMGALQRFLRENIMIRRLKRDVLTELPPKIRMLTTFAGGVLDELAAKESEAGRTFEELQAEAAAAVELAKASGTDAQYRDAVHRMQTIGKVAFEEMAALRHEMALAKVPKMIETIRERLEETQKVLVFAHHKDVLESLHNAFRPASVIVHGGHEQRDREEAVRRFQQDPGCRIFFGSIRATGEGLNLTAATLVMFHEFDWVPSKMMQCEDRAHRIGQRDTVTVEVCVVNGTLDAQMAKTCLEKADLADKALDADMAEEMKTVPALHRHAPLTQKQDFDVMVTKEQADAIRNLLQVLATFCDGARRLDGTGFSKVDAIIGRKLASLPFLSPRQTILGAKLVSRYRRQLGDDAEKIAQEILGQRNQKK